jgi:hypothetical protein
MTSNRCFEGVPAGPKGVLLGRYVHRMRAWHGWGKAVDEAPGRNPPSNRQSRNRWRCKRTAPSFSSLVQGGDLSGFFFFFLGKSGVGWLGNSHPAKTPGLRK